jgi:hypothetical protein
MKRLSRRLWVGLSVSAAILLGSFPAIAAQRVVLKYKILQESVSVQDLTTFAETGQATPDLQTYLKQSRQDPETVRQTLTKPVKINFLLLDRALNSPVGDVVLDRLGEAIQTPKGGAERQALRSALILSARSNNDFSILEVVQNYPTEEVVLDGDRAETAYRELNQFAKRIQNSLGNFLNRF